MSEKDNFEKQLGDIAQRASMMKAAFVDSQFDDNGVFIEDSKEREHRIDNACSYDAIFESLDPATRKTVISAGQAAIRQFEKATGDLPRDDALASVHRTLENMIAGDNGSATGRSKMMLESLGTSMNTSDGIELRAKMIGLVLPTTLAVPTLDAVTLMPANFDEMEIFKIRRTAGSSFGDFVKGQVIDEAANGQYSQMRQRYTLVAAQQPDGTKKEYVFTSATDLKNTKTKIPMVKRSAVVYINRRVVMREIDAVPGRLVGDFDGIALTGTVDHANGVITVTAGSAIKAGAIIDVQFEVDIESKPELIPTITHEMESCKLRPSYNAVGANSTVQAMFRMQREFNIDYRSMTMAQMRDVMAAEKAIRHLRDIKYSCVHEFPEKFNVWVPAGENWQRHRELLRQVFSSMSQDMVLRTGTSGIVGAYVGKFASTIIKSMGPSSFIPAPNYRQSNRMHYVGTLFGQYKIFEDPHILDEDEIIGYGRGDGHAESGYIAGDAIAATMYNHQIGTDLRAHNTLLELAYGEIHPFDGADYFVRLRIENTAPKIQVCGGTGGGDPEVPPAGKKAKA